MIACVNTDMESDLGSSNMQNIWGSYEAHADFRGRLRDAIEKQVKGEQIQEFLKVVSYFW